MTPVGPIELRARPEGGPDPDPARFQAGQAGRVQDKMRR